jgi:hypothetical protein
MTVPVSAPKLSDIQTEFGGANPISLSEYYRGGARVPAGQPNIGYGLIAASGTISVGTFRGANKVFTFNQTISANTSNYNLKASAIAAGWNQSDTLQATVTVNSGIYVFATTTGSYAFDTGVTFPSGSTLSVINNGIIAGRGGAGGAGGNNSGGGAGGAGGPAFRAQYATSITNNGAVGGGGGGGGGGGAYNDGKTLFNGGGGGGGRVNGTAGSGTPAGGAGSLTAAGGGGVSSGGSGGSGAGLGGAGAAGATSTYAGGAGGAAGAYITGNSNVTWVVTGTRVGGVIA